MKIALTLLASSSLLAAMGSAASPPLSDAIQRYEPVEYQLNLDGHITAYRDRINPDSQFELNLEGAPLVFPIIPEGAYHTIDMKRLKTTLELDKIEVDSQFEILPTSQTDGRMARFIIPKFRGRHVEFALEEFVTCYNAKVDEARLRAIPWTETWPAEVAAELRPQRYVESTNEEVARLLQTFTQGKHKSVAPFLLGKELARQIVQNFQVSGKNYYNDTLGQFAGLEVEGALKAIENMRGTSHDGICLYVALCRAAGLPARPVIGLDMKDKSKELLSWAEFYVPSAGWITVDFRPLYRGPGRANDIMREWPGVGGNDELNYLVPISYHFHPPAGVRAEGRAGKPLLWGWQPIPVSIPCEQYLNWKIMKAPKRSGG